MQEYDEDQRAAICYSQFRERAASTGHRAMRERLHELRRRRAELVTKMRTLVKQEEDAENGGDAAPDDLASQFAAVETAIAELDGRIQRLEAAMTADAASADDGGDGEAGFRPNGRGGSLRIPAQARSVPVEGKGFKAARFLIGLRHAGWNGNRYEKGAEFVQNRFGDTDVAKALNTIVVGEGGALIPQDFLADIIELLRAATVIRASGPMTIGMPMGNLTIPRLAGGATAYYQGELDDITLTEEVFDDVDFSAKKLTAMVPVSNDLIRRAPIGVEEIVRDDLVQTLARREDLAFLRGDGSGKSPVGLLSLCAAANLITVGALATAPLDTIVAALGAAIVTLQQGMSRMIKPCWIMAPSTLRFIAQARDSVGGFYYKDEVATGMLEGYPVRVTQQIPTNLGTGHDSEIYFADFADVVIADTMNVMVDASDVAAYYGTDGKVVSAYQRDQSLFRVISEHDFNMRHIQSLAILITTNWYPAGVPATGGGSWSTQPLNPHWAQAPAAWPANVTHDAAPTIYNPATVGSSKFAGPLTTYPGGGQTVGGGAPGVTVSSAMDTAGGGESTVDTTSGSGSSITGGNGP